jgi:hypothetical protein
VDIAGQFALWFSGIFIVEFFYTHFEVRAIKRAGDL